MSAEQNEGDINIPLVESCVKKIEEALNKSMKSGIYDMREVHELYEYYTAVVMTVKRCDALQKKLGHLVRQQELLRQADSVTPSTL